jgi:proteasome beta subunit
VNGDFHELLRSEGRLPEFQRLVGPAASEEVHGTTVLAMRYKDGVLNLGDRRATTANLVMYDRAEKILPLDDFTLIAVAGAFGKAMEVVRYLQHSFKYFARTQLHEISLEGKLQEVSRALAGNLPNALQGIGLFIPVLSAWDEREKAGRIFFYDGSGARFESGDFGAAGSGSERIRGAFHYIERVKGPFHERDFSDVLADGLRLLDIAAELDSATAGYAKILPTAKTVGPEGVREVSEDTLRAAIEGLDQPAKGRKRA